LQSRIRLTCGHIQKSEEIARHGDKQGAIVVAGASRAVPVSRFRTRLAQLWLLQSITPRRGFCFFRSALAGRVLASQSPDHLPSTNPATAASAVPAKARRGRGGGGTVAVAQDRDFDFELRWWSSAICFQGKKQTNTRTGIELLI